MTSAGRAIEILLVEDDPGDELITREAFEHNKLKNNLHVAHDGEEGLDFVYKRGQFAGAPRPDLILLDLNLPKEQGLQLLAEIKNDPALREIPVNVFSASSWDIDVIKAYGMYANSYFVKPLRLEQFVEMLRVLDTVWFETARLPSRL